MNAKLRTPLLWLLPCLLLGGHVAAQPDEHAPLATSATLRFRDILDSTLHNAPEMSGTEVRQQQAQAYAGAARSWLAGRPSAVVAYINDNTLDHQGLQEQEYGVQLPLWRPGEKRDAMHLGEQYQQQSQLWLQALQLTLAGRVRNLLAGITEAEQLLAIEQQATSDAQQLKAVTQRLFETGAVARIDVLQTDNLLLEQQQRLLQAEAAMKDAEIVYRVTTGLNVKPATAFIETLNSADEITPAHPLLQYLQSSVDVAAASIRQSEMSARGNPQLTVGTRRQRGDRFQPTIDSVAISVTIPFGGSAYVSSRTSAARMQEVDAQVQLRNTQREMQLALHEAEHELSVTRARLPLAQQQAAIGNERSELAQRAFALAELNLVQVLPAMQEARTSARALAMLQQKQQRLIADYNQVLGVLP